LVASGVSDGVDGTRIGWDELVDGKHIDQIGIAQAHCISMRSQKRTIPAAA
jgi:hypothetical protein